MTSHDIKIKYINGATALFEIGGLRFLTDPTFDPADTIYNLGPYSLHKLTNPSILADKIGHIDFVLLSHDHHRDNLDTEGRKLLEKVEKVYTTPEGAERLGGNAIGIRNWEMVEISTKDGRIITITGTPCRHGPLGGDRGPVTGFLLNFKGETNDVIYITGDTVWYEGVKEVGNRFDVSIVVAFLGAAVVKEVGPAHLTMTVEEATRLARHFDKATIVPLHFDGWEHFTESRAEILREFQKAGLEHRLKWADEFQ